MDERRRQAYLQAMGVDSYYPRFVLPAAPLSSRCIVPDNVTTPVAVESAASFIPQPVLKKASSPIDHLPPAPLASVRAAPIVQSFHLAVVAIDKQLLIVDECPPSLRSSKQYRQLLQNIVLALGLGRCDITIHAFQWPMVKSNKLTDSSEAAAREALHAYLSRRIERSAIPRLLLMGDAAAHYVISDLPTTHTLSASRMLTEPEHKRQLWQQLQPLVREK